MRCCSFSVSCRRRRKRRTCSGLCGEVASRGGLRACSLRRAGEFSARPHWGIFSTRSGLEDSTRPHVGCSYRYGAPARGHGQLWMEAVNDGHITLLSKPSAKSAPPRQAPHGPVFAYSKSKMLPNLPTGQPALFGGGVQDNSLVNPLYPNFAASFARRTLADTVGNKRALYAYSRISTMLYF